MVALQRPSDAIGDSISRCGAARAGRTGTGIARHRTPVRVDISSRSFVRALVAIALVWVWLRLWRWVLVFLVAVFLAIALDPVVRRLEARGLARKYAAPLVALVLTALLAGFFAISGASLAQEARLLGGRVGEFQQQVLARIPADMRQAGASIAPSSQSLANAARAFAGGLAGLVVALILTLYLLLDGRRTFEWLLAFVPMSARSRAEETARGAHEAIYAYVRGNVITSTLAAIATWIFLAALQVPAALLLALLAGILDFVPVIGFFLSAAPAVLLGFAVSPTVGISVAVFYVLYNAVENYYIQPKVYGRELRLSDLAVIAAFLVGAELGGVLGAIVALPLAAVYPTIERVWLNRREDLALPQEHQRIESQPKH
jgi:predicted PurR-regulated permease PerM